MSNDKHAIEDLNDLKAVYDEPIQLALDIKRDHLDRFHKKFINNSTFLCIASTDSDGNPSVSPKGDPPGFVKILDDQTLVLPDRPGNRQLHTLRRVLDNPGVAMNFFVPGVDEVLRVRGKASITRDEDLLSELSVKGHNPPSAMVITVEEAWIHCGKAIKRARLWDDARHVNPEDFPSYGKIIAEEAKISREEADSATEHAYENEMY